MADRERGERKEMGRGGGEAKRSGEKDREKDRRVGGG